MRTLIFKLLAATALIVGLVAVYPTAEPAEPNRAQPTGEISLSERGTHRYAPTHRQEIWLAVLEWCESRGFPDAYNPIDTNGKPSYGALQFQIDTFLKFGKQYGILQQEMAEKEAEKRIYDYELQKTIAHRMLSDGLAHHWKACYRVINEPYPTTNPDNRL